MKKIVSLVSEPRLGILNRISRLLCPCLPKKDSSEPFSLREINYSDLYGNRLYNPPVESDLNSVYERSLKFLGEDFCEEDC